LFILSSSSKKWFEIWRLVSWPLENLTVLPLSTALFGHVTAVNFVEDGFQVDPTRLCTPIDDIEKVSKSIRSANKVMVTHQSVIQFVYLFVYQVYTQSTNLNIW